MAASENVAEGGIGSAHAYHGLGVKPFLAALIGGLTMACVQMALFLILRRKMPKFFKPKRIDASSKRVLRTQGLDAYLFQRYLKTLAAMFAPIAVFVAPVLIALNVSGGRGQGIMEGSSDGASAATPSGLDTLAWGNIGKNQARRYWAHLVMAEAVVAWVCWVVYHELSQCAKLRQDFLSTEEREATMLVTNVHDVNNLRRVLSRFPEVHKVTKVPDLRQLETTVKARDATIRKLEIGEAKLLNTIYQAEKKGSRPCAPFSFPHDKEVWQDVDGQQRPAGWDIFRWFTQGASSLRFDVIYTARDELEKLEMRTGKELLHLPPGDAAIVRFGSPSAARLASQVMLDPRPGGMKPCAVGFGPEDLVWRNLSMSWRDGRARSAAVAVILSSMLAFWAVPVAWIAALANIDSVAETLGFLDELKHDPQVRNVAGAAAGVLAPALLNAVLALIPVLLDRLAVFCGVRTMSQRSAFVQRYYFMFLFVQVFLVVSIASFFSTSARELWGNLRAVHRVDVVAGILATNLPKAANYFLSHFVLHAFLSSSGTLLQPMALVWHWIRPLLLTWTPRRARDWQDHVVRVDLSSAMPEYTVLACVGLIYSAVAPLISVVATLMFGLSWAAQRNNFSYVAVPDRNTKGTLYLRAINQMFTGLYVMELLLAGLFMSLSRENPSSSGDVQCGIMLGTLVATVVYQVALNRTFGTCFSRVALSLSDEKTTTDIAGDDWVQNPDWPAVLSSLDHAHVLLHADRKGISSATCRAAKDSGLNYKLDDENRAQAR